MSTLTTKDSTPRYTEEEVRQAVAPLQKRIAELEAKLKQPSNES